MYDPALLFGTDDPASEFVIPSNGLYRMHLSVTSQTASAGQYDAIIHKKSGASWGFGETARVPTPARGMSRVTSAPRRSEQ